MGKLISVNFKERKSSYLFSFKTTRPVTRVGICLGCGEFDELKEGACPDCVAYYGDKCGHTFLKIRTDPKFAHSCYSKIKNENAKRMFVEWFGKPDVAKNG